MIINKTRFNNPNLEFVTLRACELNDESVKILSESLKQNISLKLLDLYGNKITKDGIRVYITN